MCRCHLSKRARCRSPSYSAFLRLRRSPPCVFSLRLAWRSALGLQISCHRGVPSTTPPHQMARRCADGACPRLEQGLSWRDTRTAGTAAHVPPSLTKPWQPARDTRPSPRSLDWANATGSRWHTTHDQYPGRLLLYLPNCIYLEYNVLSAVDLISSRALGGGGRSPTRVRNTVERLTLLRYSDIEVHRMGHSTTRGCSFAGSSTAAVVSDLTGNVTYRAAPSTVFSMPWEGLKGLHTVVLAQTTLKDLCSLEGASWAGSVVLGGDFSGGGCSFERRALAAASRQAAGILFHGWTLGEHQPFDWDGSSQTGLAAGALALNEEYICIQQAVFAAGGQAKIELTPEVTPLSATWYLALGRTLFAVLCVAQTSNVVVGALQQARFHQSGMEIMTRAVVGMEMFSQIMFLVKILNGPGCARDLCLRDSSFLPQARCIPK